MDEVGRRMTTFRNKSAKPDAWSSLYVGCLIVADKDLEGHWIEVTLEPAIE